jgi:hypothetical protein
MKTKIFFLSVVIFFFSFSNGQSISGNKKTAFYGGIGAGFDYGGIGFKIEFLPVKNIGFFAGGGYNLIELGYNGGLSWKINPKKSWTPTLVAMYGYNAVLIAKSSFGINEFKKTYYGFTAGCGFDFKVGKKNNKVSLTLFVPFRSSAFRDKYDYYKSFSYDFKPDIFPVTLSMGMNIGG